MATAKNKLPIFGTNASVDSSIVNGTSELANTGFQANTIIRSAQVNTYLKVLMNNVNGLIDAIYNAGASQGEISATSSSDDVKNYITAGLSKIIAGTKVDDATHADEATNSDTCNGNAGSATKLETARTITFEGAVTGETSFDGTTDLTATMKFNCFGADEDGKPCFVNKSNNQLVNISKLEGRILLAPDNRQNNNLSVQNLSNMYKNVGSDDSIFVSGGAEKLTSSLGADVNVGDSYKPVYFRGGIPVVCNLLDAIYPVGSIYMSTNNVSPEDFLGGIWIKIEGRFLLGAGGGYNAGDTGGEATHKLAESEMPRHNHLPMAPFSYASGGSAILLTIEGKPIVRSTQSFTPNVSGEAGGVTIDYAGGDNAHNNMPPYLVVYIWKRTA